MTDVTVFTAGEAGLGMQSATAVLTRVLARSGYHVFAYPDVMSRVRGGHNCFRIRISERPVASVSGRANVVLAFDQRSVEEHLKDLVPQGVVIFEGDGPVQEQEGAVLLPVPMAAAAKKAGASPAAMSVVALGGLTALNGQPLKPLLDTLKLQFEAKGEEVVRQNAACVQAGFDHVRSKFTGVCPCLIPALPRPRPKLLMSGGQAIGLGALAGGVQFYAGYPMSPSTPVMEYLAGKAEQAGIVVEQVEDEVSAINMVCGAAYAGARAMTATSGGGFSLMVEALGLAGMAELPLVVVLAQRPGPGTGFPTRTEQAELLFAVNCSQDEFPRFVLAPADAEQAFAAMPRAFDLAHKWQVPAIVLVDQFIVESFWTSSGLGAANAERVKSETQSRGQEPYTYRRYELNESGVSPFLAPGTRDQLVCSEGSEHDEAGLSTEDAGNRVRMVEKRMRKLGGMAEEFGRFEALPEQGAGTLLCCWGSTRGAVREAVDALRQAKQDVGMVHFSEPWPFPRDRAKGLLAAAKRVLTVENNSTGQLAKLLARAAGAAPDGMVLKYDGRPFSVSEIVEHVG